MKQVIGSHVMASIALVCIPASTVVSWDGQADKFDFLC